MNDADSDGAAVSGTPFRDRLIDRLFRSEAPRLARFIRRSVPNQDEVHDLVQETFVSFVAARPRSRLHTPEAYLRSIARHLLWRSKRAAVRYRIVHLPIDEARDAPVDAEQEWMIEASDFMRRYEQALAELPSQTREVFRLHRQEDLTYPQIAKELGINVTAVKYHMRKAIRYLDHRVNTDD